MSIQITPNPECKACHGIGKVKGDSVPVPFGIGNCSLPDSYCDCVYDQIPDEGEEFDDEIDIELTLAPNVLEAEYEWSQDPNIGCLGCGLDLKDCECHPEKEDYDYARDDFNFDAARERRFK